MPKASKNHLQYSNKHIIKIKKNKIGGHIKPQNEINGPTMGRSKILARSSCMTRGILSHK